MKTYKIYTKEKGLAEMNDFMQITNLTLHRTDGPAVIRYYKNGNIEYEEYYINNQLHRLNGPAIIKYENNGTVISSYFWIRGMYYTKEDYQKEILTFKINLL